MAEALLNSMWTADFKTNIAPTGGLNSFFN